MSPDIRKVAHLTTIDASLRYLVFPQLVAVRQAGGVPIGISAPGPFVTDLIEAGIRHIPLSASTRGISPTSDVRAALQLWRILREEQVDVLHTHNPKPGLYGRIIGRLAGVPLVVNTVHGLYATPDDPLFKRLVVYGLEAVASRFSHVELVQSREDYELLTRWRISPRKRTRLLGNGVDLDRFDPARLGPGVRRVVRQELGLSDDTVVVGIVGRLVAEKGYPELLEAAAGLGPGFSLVCVGPNDPEKADALPEELITRAEQNGVRFLGMRTDVDRLYCAMDLFVLPSHREGFPRAAMEAAAMGIPIIATDIRGCREVVEDGVNGVLVPVSDSSALRKAILDLGNDRDQRLSMGACSRRKALREFDEKRVVRTVIESYQEPNPHHLPYRSAIPLWGRVAKRVVDFALSAVLLCLLSPFMALIASVIRWRLGSPVFFRQVRPGLHGRPFTITKFRTLTDAVDDDGALLSDEERMTSFGRLLRSSSLDELPELINVLKGEMSLVGPRPLLMAYLERYDERQGQRHDVKPGLTGWAQVNGRNAVSWEEKLEMDVWYVNNWSMRLDLAILARTLTALLRPTGISEPGHATASEFQGGSGNMGERR